MPGRTDYSNAYLGIETSTENGSRSTGIAEAQSRGFDSGTKSYTSTPAVEEKVADTTGSRPESEVGDGHVMVADSVWLREDRIVSNSQPWLKVTFNPYASDSNDIIVAYRTEITSAEFECPTNINTTGSISIMDPEGVWPSRLTRVGAIMNSIADAGKPNIKVEFGWIGLDYGRDRRGGTKIKYITGIILGVGFDVSDTGVTTAKIDFVQTPYVSLDLVRVISPEDIKIIYDWNKDDTEFRTGPVSYKLRKLCAWDSGLQIGEQLKKLNLELRFEDTADGTFDYDATHGMAGSSAPNNLTIRYGDKLDDIINHFTAKAKPLDPPSKVKDDVSQVYSRMSAPIFADQSDSNYPKQILDYKWTMVPKVGSADPDKTEKDAYPDKTSAGKPILAWKIALDPSKGKQLLEWTSDLSSFYKIIAQAQDAFDRKLNDFSDKDWKVLTKSMEKEGNNFVDDTTLFENVGSFFSGKPSDRTAMREEFQETIDQYNNEIQGTASSQLGAIISQNTFNGTAKIMGDPTIGTDYDAWYSKFFMNFNAVGKFASLFSRDWTLKKAKHIFGDGSYITEMEMVCYPIPKEKIPESDEIKDAHADAY